MQDILRKMDTLDMAYIIVTILSTILWIMKIARKYDDLGQ